MVDRNHSYAYLDLTLAMAILGSTLVLGKNLLGVFPVFTLLFLRFLIGTLYFLPSYARSYKSSLQAFQELRKRDWFLLFTQAFFGAFLFNLFMLLGLRYTSANLAALITAMLPIFITIFAAMLLKEHISKYKLIAIIISFTGFALATANFSWQHSSTDLLGCAFVLIAIITGALFPVCARALTATVSTRLIALTFNVFGLILFAPFLAIEINSFNFHLITQANWLLLIFYSLAANVFYLQFWNKGLVVVPANTASLFIPLMPISTAILAYFVLGEVPTLFQMIGGGLILLAIVIGARAR